MNGSDFFNLFAQEKYGAPKEWQWIYVGDLKSDTERRFAKLEGGVYKTVFKRGPRKGKINAKKPEPGTFRSYVFPFEEFLAFQENYLKDHNLCSECYGEGETMTRWSREKGVEKEVCKKCKGSGKHDDQHEPLP